LLFRCVAELNIDLIRESRHLTVMLRKACFY
jgi:hypothetical protein